MPNVVSRGDVVSMVVTGDGFSIHREAEALEGGALGEWIRVKLDAKGSVKRVVTRPGELAEQQEVRVTPADFKRPPWSVDVRGLEAAKNELLR